MKNPSKGNGDDNAGWSVWLIRGYPIKDINDRFTEMVEVVQEITQHKQSETALIEAEEKYGTLVENSLTGIYIIDQDGKIAFANNKFVETYRYSKKRINRDRILDTGSSRTHAFDRQDKGKTIAGGISSLGV